jgi:transcription termination factor NusB
MTIYPRKLEIISSEFEAEVRPESVVKTAFIKHMPSGKWRVLSQKGKSLGEYGTKEEAVKRLRQVEYFKHHKKRNKKASNESYSSMVRELNKKEDSDALDTFQNTFKNEFDKAYVNGEHEPETIALDMAMKAIAQPSYNELLFKAASVLEMGDPEYAGQYISQIIRFILQRISSDKQAKALDLMKRKIWYINEYDISAKKVPASAAYGTGITLLKHLLMGHTPKYTRSVLNSIVRHL